MKNLIYKFNENYINVSYNYSFNLNLGENNKIVISLIKKNTSLSALIKKRDIDFNK
jgi:hypothetical protein